MKKIMIWMIGGIMLYANENAPFKASDTTKLFEVEAIVVTATRIPQFIRNVSSPVSIITEKDIKSSPFKTVDELLKTVAGIDITRPYGETSVSHTVSLRGIYGTRCNRTLILLDGVPLNDLYNGAVNLNTIPLEDIERIEIVRGASSALYGSNALGGVINIITKNPGRKFQAELNAGGGNMRKWVGELKLTTLYKSLGCFISGKRYHTDGYQNVPPEERKSYYTYTNRKMDEEDFFSKLTYNLNSNLKFYSRFLHHYDKTNYGRKNYFGKINQNRLMIGFDFNKNSSSFSFNLFLDNLNDFYTSTKSGDVIDYENLGDKDFWGANFQNNFTLTPSWDISWGMDYKQGKIKSRDEYKTSDRERFVKGKGVYGAFFIQNKFQIANKFLTYLGGRFDWWKSFDGESFDSDYDSIPLGYKSRTNSNFNPKLGIVYIFDNDLIFRTSIARAFRAPSFYELYRTWYWWGYTFASNPDLNPEKVLCYDIGIEKIFGSRAFIRLTFYYNQIKDLIYSVSVLNKYYKKKNVAEAQTRGVEFESKYKFNRFFTLFLNYTYNHSRIEKCSEKPELEGKYLVHSPFNKANFGITYENPIGLFINLSVGYTGIRFDDDENEVKLRDYTIFNLGIRWKIKYGFEFWANIENLTNETYSEHEGTFAPPRSFIIGLKKGV